uniref:Uncharacterized protein n=1 Tax=Glossina austeni TaxID=7395 RepID=A0A1A9VG82_GLOAU
MVKEVPQFGRRKTQRALCGENGDLRRNRRRGHDYAGAKTRPSVGHQVHYRTRTYPCPAERQPLTTTPWQNNNVTNIIQPNNKSSHSKYNQVLNKNGCSNRSNNGHIPKRNDNPGQNQLPLNQPSVVISRPSSAAVSGAVVVRQQRQPSTIPHTIISTTPKSRQ